MAEKTKNKSVFSGRQNSGQKAGKQLRTMLVAFYDGEAAQMSSVVRIRYAVKCAGVRLRTATGTHRCLAYSHC